MERRVALKNMAAAMGAMVVMPAWASGWNTKAVSAVGLLDAGKAETLALVVETIIPKTDTPGARELGVGGFVEKMVKDCYDAKAQAGLSAGLDAVEAISKKNFNKSYADLTKQQQLSLLEGIDKGSDADLKGFLGLVKNLTIQGYTSSEYVMTNITHYEMIPARYHGCVPVKK
ncbi:gluconate 2-dehydrogenase subunit 3 family protein [Dyadobacter luteus]|jgi:hypothetical protein|nr:gluconate 2-dehydrogenase subunit 3 family protein [Dyadobacter luteus]